MSRLQSRLQGEVILLNEHDSNSSFIRQLMEVMHYSRFMSRRDAEFLSEQGISAEVIAIIKEYIACEHINSIISEFCSKKTHTPAQKRNIIKQLRSILEEMEQ